MVQVGAVGSKRGTAMSSIGSIRVVSRREIGVVYCLLSRPTHARSGEIGCHLPGVRERAVAVQGYDPVLFQGS